MRKYRLVISFVLFFMLSLQVNATELTDELLGEYDFTEAQESVEDSLPQDTPSMKELLEKALHGEILISPANLCKIAVESVKEEAAAQKKLFAVIILSGLLAALCKNLAGFCENRQIVSLGYYFIYLLLAIYLLNAFMQATQIADECITHLIEFLQVLLPSYFIAVGVAVGSSTATGFYQIAMLGIYVVWGIMKILLIPGCCIYMFLTIINGISGEDRMASLLRLLLKLIQYVQKTCMTVIGGLGIIQGLVSPVLDGVGYGAAKKILAAIPGVGNVTDATLQMVTGSLLLLKNGIGAVILVVMILLCVVPLVRITVIVLVLKGGSALIGMVTDFRIVQCSDRIGSGSLQLLKILASASALNFVTVAMVASLRGSN